MEKGKHEMTIESMMNSEQFSNETETLEQVKKRLNNIITDSNDAITVQFIDGRIVAWNKGAELMYGYSEAEALQMNISEIVPGQKKQEALDFIRQLKKGEAVNSLETQRITKDNKILDVWLTITKITDDLGNMIAVATTERDITERNQNAQEMKRLNMDLTNKNRELEDIMRAVSHDLRSPIVSIVGYSKTLGSIYEEVISIVENENASSELNEMLRPFFKDISESLKYLRASATNMESLLNGFAKLLRMGSVSVEKTLTDMNKLLSRVKNDFKLQTNKAGVEIDVMELPDCIGDELQIYQLFSNLLGNALKYLDPDREGIIKVSGYQKEDNISVYCVEDNGIGIAAEYHDKIFGMFYQIDSSEKQGQGLGLSIVRKIIEMNNGKIHLESEAGKGSKFFISLPS